MNRLKALFAAAVVAPLLMFSPAKADEPAQAWQLALSTGFFSDYMFRGFNLYDGTSVQPSSTVTYKSDIGNISASLWMHLSAEGDRQAEKFTEIDETLSYDYTFDKWTVKVGHVWYTYPDNGDEIVDTAEWFATFVFNDSELSPFALTPVLSVYQDYREFDNQYYELGVSHTVAVEDLGKDFSFTPFASFGFASNADKVYESDGLVQVTFGTSFALTLGDVQVSPSLNYTCKVDDNATNEFWVGTSFGYSL